VRRCHPWSQARRLARRRASMLTGPAGISICLCHAQELRLGDGCFSGCRHWKLPACRCSAHEGCSVVLDVRAVLSWPQFLAMLFVLMVPLLASAQVCWWACWRWARGCRRRARWARRGCWPGRCSSLACLRSPAGKVGGQLLTGPFSPACNGRYMHAVVRLPAGSKSGATGLDGPFEH